MQILKASALLLLLSVVSIDAAVSMPRIVSLSPHITELLFAAGAAARVVGVDDLSDYPAATAQIVHVGEVTALDTEVLVKLKPTIVILWDSGTSPQRKADIGHLGLNVYPTEQRHLDDIATALIDFGRLAGTSAVAAAAAQQYRYQLDELRHRYAHRAQLRVFYQVWDRPLYTLSREHVVNEVLTLCGGSNIFAELHGLAPMIDKEAVLARDPDVIIIGATGAEGARQAAEWNRITSLHAVRHHRVYTVDDSLMSRMSPRILLGVRSVCESLDQARVL